MADIVLFTNVEMDKEKKNWSGILNADRPISAVYQNTQGRHVDPMFLVLTKDDCKSFTSLKPSFLNTQCADLDIFKYYE